MKIVYVYKALALWGGIERIFTNKMNYLSEQYGYDVTIITTCQGDHTVPYPLSSKVKHIDLNIRFHTKYRYGILKKLWVGHQMNIKFKKLLKKQFNTINPDIIIVTTDLYMDVVSQLANGIPVIAESHSDKYQNLLSNNGKKLNVIRQYEQNKYLKSINKVTKLVTLTEQDTKIWNIPEKTVIIPNCIHSNHEKYSTCENKQVIFVGRFSYQKGIDYAIDIWENSPSEASGLGTAFIRRRRIERFICVGNRKTVFKQHYFRSCSHPAYKQCIYRKFYVYIDITLRTFRVGYSGGHVLRSSMHSLSMRWSDEYYRRPNKRIINRQW